MKSGMLIVLCAVCLSVFINPMHVNEITANNEFLVTGEIDEEPLQTAGCFQKHSTLSDDHELILPEVNVSKNATMEFSADIIAFSKIQIGRKNSAYLEIDEANITVKNSGDSDIVIPHGLTIVNDLTVRIIQPNEITSDPIDYYFCLVELISNEDVFTTPLRSIPLVYCTKTYGNPFVKAVDSELRDCVFSYTPHDISKSIYILGDSYVSFYRERWMYYLIKDNYGENVLINAYPGEGSGAAINALKNLLSLGYSPQYIVWCMGMNDGSDSRNAPSKTWVKGRDEFLKICESYGITPVFATIPTVPTINHEMKNKWIRNSGYQYIDFAKAVGANAKGGWYPGMIDGDHVHPSESGAAALYERVLLDFPQIMCEE